MRVAISLPAAQYPECMGRLLFDLNDGVGKTGLSERAVGEGPVGEAIRNGSRGSAMVEQQLKGSRSADEVGLGVWQDAASRSPYCK